MALFIANIQEEIYATHCFEPAIHLEVSNTFVNSMENLEMCTEPAKVSFFPKLCTRLPPNDDTKLQRIHKQWYFLNTIKFLMEFF